VTCVTRAPAHAQAPRKDVIWARTTNGAPITLDGVLNEAGPGGMTRDEVEAKFRQLEAGVGPVAETLKNSEVDEELQAIKRKVRIGD